MTDEAPGTQAGDDAPASGAGDPESEPKRGRASKGAEAYTAAEREAQLAAAGEVEPPDPEPISLDEDEQELIQLELDALGPVRSPQRKRAYEALGDGVDEGSVPADLVPLLERLVAVSLESGRARKHYLAEGEKLLTRLFRRTPSGKQLTESLKGVNQALDVLDDRTITDVKVSLRTLGHFRIVLETEDVRLTLSVRSSSVVVESLAVTGGG